MYIERIKSLADEEYRDFTAKLIPNINIESIIGVRIPKLRSLARDIVKEGKYEPFVEKLPHRYHEENLLHAFILTLEKRPINEVISRIDSFLPFINNWAVCDCMSPKIFARHKQEVYSAVKRWASDRHDYTRRFAAVTSLQFFLDDNFELSHLDDMAAINTCEYYVMMGVAWYFSVALVKQWEATLPYIIERRLPYKVHNMAIQKAIESLRITADKKEQLRLLKYKIV